ncbi:hypothetical protein F2Q69_00023134 [Brassica cretica]|uniref:Uncharacterized protein n=1 Tax=Brassica cretica TaxID=69181 RepID=A0A8S9Q5F9_BRACR|nr:hypothetical protein F2Q69_00023134 [Brassica cretica]
MVQTAQWEKGLSKRAPPPPSGRLGSAWAWAWAWAWVLAQWEKGLSKRAPPPPSGRLGSAWAWAWAWAWVLGLGTSQQKRDLAEKVSQLSTPEISDRAIHE